MKDYLISDENVDNKFANFQNCNECGVEGEVEIKVSHKKDKGE